MDTSAQAKKEYQKMVEKASPNSHLAKDCIKAFVSGGLICVGGQGLINLFHFLGYSADASAMYTSISLIFIAAVLTGLGIYDQLGKFCGAGTIVPITGFSNSVVSPAMEFKKEGLILGMGAKMFLIAGPVIVYGILTSVVVGILYYFLG